MKNPFKTDNWFVQLIIAVLVVATPIGIILYDPVWLTMENAKAGLAAIVIISGLAFGIIVALTPFALIAIILFYKTTIFSISPPTLA